MLNKFFTKPIELIIAEQTFKFCSIADFEFCLAGRTSVPSKKITDMVKFSTDQLKKEAKIIKGIEKRFVSILSKSIEDTESINRALRELDPVIFSQDHAWRDIIFSLNQGAEELNPFRRIALVKYMQYLSARQEIIKYLYSEKKKYTNEANGEPAVEAGQYKDICPHRGFRTLPLPERARASRDARRNGRSPLRRRRRRSSRSRR